MGIDRVKVRVVTGRTIRRKKEGPPMDERCEPRKRKKTWWLKCHVKERDSCSNQTTEETRIPKKLCENRRKKRRTILDKTAPNASKCTFKVCRVGKKKKKDHTGKGFSKIKRRIPPKSA